MNRRLLLLGAGAALAAPAIIPVERLMKLYVPKRLAGQWADYLVIDDPFDAYAMTAEMRQGIVRMYLFGQDWLETRNRHPEPPIITRSRLAFPEVFK